MCARIFYFVLAAFLTFNIATIVAFVYLPWWQALIVVAGTIIMLMLASMVLIKYFFRNMANMSTEMLAQQAMVLKNAQVTVHAIRTAEMPPEVRDLLVDEENEDVDAEYLQQERARVENLIWREIELSIFPDMSQLQPGDAASWSPFTLCLVPETWAYDDEYDLDDEAEDDGSITVYNMRLVIDGDHVEPTGEDVQGPQRIIFIAGIPRQLSTVSLAYLTEKFGIIQLSGTLPPSRKS